MTWFVVGAQGMLGQDMVHTLAQAGHEVRGLGRDGLDITDPGAVRAQLKGASGVINCAAYTAVDNAEIDEAQAFLINAIGPSYLARSCAEQGVPIVHISTDYVFDGQATTPYAADQPLRPLGAYGRSKAAGEWAVRAESAAATVVRVAWLYGAAGKCFPKTIARVARERGAISVVADQVGQPTWTVDVARVVSDIIERQAFGATYHATSSGACSWFEFAQAVVVAAGMSGDCVSPIGTQEFPTPAARPAYSVLDHASLVKAGIAPIPDWASRWDEAATTIVS